MRVQSVFFSLVLVSSGIRIASAAETLPRPILFVHGVFADMGQPVADLALNSVYTVLMVS